MALVKPLYERELVNQSGRLLRKVVFRESDEAVSDSDWAKWDTGLLVVNNWRSSHAYPLNAITVNLRLSARRFDSGSLVAQRIKRLVSIAHKLDRFPNMKLSQMQDLGGCRAVLQNVTKVRELVTFYEKHSRMTHERATFDDYIENPKSSGYRGAHFVFRYHTDQLSMRAFRGLKIEMQVRSRYQHAWATAVETVGTFSGQALKSSLGSEQWQHFFSLMGSVIAMREKTALVPGTPSGRKELISELFKYANELKAVDRLRGYGRAIRTVLSPASANASYFLLELDPSEGTLSVSGFTKAEVPEATERYATAEKRARESTGRDAVLVSVESIAGLSRAYPNYFADTRVFLQLLNQALSGHSRGIVVPTSPINTPDSPPLPPGVQLNG